MMLSRLFAAVLLLSTACFAQNECQTTTVTDSAPGNETKLALQGYSYCGGSLNVTAYIAVRALLAPF